MKLKTFTAQSMAEAMEAAKQEFGSDVLIVSSERDGLGGGVRITIAIEEQGVSEKEIEQALFGETIDETSSEISEVLHYHAIPDVLCERITMHANKSQSDDIAEALSYSFNEILRLSEIKPIKNKIIMAVGPAGSGKSSIIAKMATLAKLKGQVPGIISTDTYRAGANAQLQAFSKILGSNLITVQTPDEIIDATKKLFELSDVIFIDTAAVNPYSDKDLIKMSEYINILPNIEPLLVFETGRDTEETVEQLCIFAENGVTSLSATKLDTTKRLGGIIAGTYHSNLNLRDFSISSSIAGSLKPVTADLLTKLLLPVGFLNKE